VRTPNPRVELPYTYLMAWNVMYCPSLMTTVSPSEGFVPLVHQLESSSWSQYYMFYVRKTILAARTISSTGTSPRSLVRHTGTSLLTLQARMSSHGYHLESFGGSSISDPDTWSFDKVIPIRSSLKCLVVLLGCSATISYMLATPTLAFASAVTCLKAPGSDITL